MNIIEALTNDIVVMITRKMRKHVVGHVTDDFILLQKTEAILLF